MTWLLLIGLLAGTLSTVSGMGGGLLLVLAGSALIGPHETLALTAPAMLAGNLHRAWLFRDALNREIALPFVAAAAPAALVGGALAGALPAEALQLTLVAVTVLALLRALGPRSSPAASASDGRRVARSGSGSGPGPGPGPEAGSARPERGRRPPLALLLPAGALAGAIAGTAGAATIVSPALLAAGLRGRPFIATACVAASSMHLARGLAYGASGLLDAHTLQLAPLLAIAVMAGNHLGARLRPRLGEATCHRLTMTVLVSIVALSVAPALAALP